ncbi:hypothetical protein RLEG12_05395 (plasmid) [Rhizobium leguminosarum bv. trifolii CB782]|nr:hypothetical protein RLEG12_05395 [Rhizobium leguminosarum bv. trifolii CB782]
MHQIAIEKIDESYLYYSFVLCQLLAQKWAAFDFLL